MANSRNNFTYTANTADSAREDNKSELNKNDHIEEGDKEETHILSTFDCDNKLLALDVSGCNNFVDTHVYSQTKTQKLIDAPSDQQLSLVESGIVPQSISRSPSPFSAGSRHHKENVMVHIKNSKNSVSIPNLTTTGTVSTSQFGSLGDSSYSFCKSCLQALKCDCCDDCTHVANLKNSISKQHMSSVTFTTVTNATGLPIIANEPLGDCSSSFWSSSSNVSHGEFDRGGYAVSTPPAPSSTNTGGKRSLGASSNTLLPTTSLNKNNGNILKKRSQQQGMSAFEEGSRDSEDSQTSEDTVEKRRVSPFRPRAHSEVSSGESSRLIQATDLITCYKCGKNMPKDEFALALIRNHCKPFTPLLYADREKNEVGKIRDHTIKQKRKSISSEDIREDEFLDHINEWAFPIFEYSTLFPRSILTRMAYKVFTNANLFNLFQIKQQKFFTFFTALEHGYWSIPYHNRIHAADVLHGCYYLTVHPISAFKNQKVSKKGDNSKKKSKKKNLPKDGQSSSNASCEKKKKAKSNESKKCCSGNAGTSGVKNEVKFHPNSKLPMITTMSNLEVMAFYTAAAMHDYDHPGKTNAFLVASDDYKAIMYNDRSVLENHHACEAWKLLCIEEHLFIDVLDENEFRRFRYLVLEYILATDLKMHFDLVALFKDKIHDIDFYCEKDRLQMMQMLIKTADISSPMKPRALHMEWTNRICEEFYEQGDLEKALEMPVTQFMDRNEPNVEELQASFIGHIVAPLAKIMDFACFLPILPGLQQSELIINLNHNDTIWKNRIEEKKKVAKIARGENPDLSSEDSDEEDDEDNEFEAPEYNNENSSGEIIEN